MIPFWTTGKNLDELILIFKEKMKHMKKYIMMLLAGSLVACNESYPGIYEDEEEIDRPSEEVTRDTVPILMSLSDPEYSIVTRGLGALEDWGIAANREKWRNAVFHVFAFLDRNHDFTGTPDYSGLSEDNLYCLVYDRGVQIKGNVEPSLQWVGDQEPPIYNLNFPDYKYNFFAYCIDDAPCLREEHLSDRVIKHIEIDGTQDIITAFAKPTQRQIEQIQTDDEFKYIAANWENLIYSTRTGNRGISPVLHLNHEMVKFDFKVVGAADTSDDLLVEAVSLTTPRKGALTVAEQPQEGQDPVLGVVWDETDREKIYLATPNTPNVYGATEDRSNALFDPLIQVGRNDTVALGNILLPAVKTFRLQIEYKLKSEVEQGMNSYYTATYQNVSLKDGIFQAGYEYEVLLKVYGPQKVELQIGSQTMGWADGGTLPPIDEDYE